MAEFVNTFEKGLNLDIDYSMIPPNQYVECDNLKISTSIGGSTGALETVDGNYLITSGLLPSNSTIIGHGYIRDDLYLFVCIEPEDRSWIVKLDITNGVPSSTVIYRDDSFTDKLSFKYDHKIKCVGRYETSDIQKLYWVDGIHPLRSINVVKDNTLTSPGQLDIIPNAPITPPTITSVGNGSLLTGTYQYVYQYVTNNGSETMYSPPSSPFPLTTTSQLAGNNKTFIGNSKGTNTGHSINITIPITAGYDRIRVVAIQYQDKDTIPSIKLMLDKKLSTTDTSMVVTDYGYNYVSDITLEELTLLSTASIIGTEIETKNDYLFVGNITEGTFDVNFDTRAYRFYGASITETTYKKRRHCILSSRIRTLNETDAAAIDINGVGTLSTQFDAIPSTHNCINVDNYIYTNNILESQRSNSDDHMIYQSNGTVIGGTGPNISYQFNNNASVIISTYTSITNYEEYSNIGDINSLSKYNFKSYQRDEIYRCGIVFFNAKGQNTPVKWIGDIRMPKTKDGNGTEFQLTYISGNNIYANILGITFNINNTASLISQGVTSYKIVRVQRDSLNRTILAQGLCGSMSTGYPDGIGLGYRISFPTRYLYNNTPPYTSHWTFGYDDDLVSMLEFSSPEVNFNKNIAYNTGDKLVIAGYVNNENFHIFPDPPLTSYFPSIANDTFIADYSSNIPFTLFDYLTYSRQGIDNVNRATNAFNFTEKVGTYAGLSFITDITDAKILTPNEKWITNRNTTVHNTTSFIGSYNDDYTNKQNIQTNHSSGGTKLFLQIPIGAYTNDIAYLERGLLCNYVRPYNDIYGGADYSARLKNTYIECCDNTIINITSKSVLGGDTYISMYDYLRVYYPDLGTDYFANTPVLSNILFFPIETQINLRYRSDVCFSKDSSYTNYKFQEKEVAGTYIRNPFPEYVQKTDLYIYNNVYSQEDSVVNTYLPPSDPLGTVDTNKDCRIYGSNKKTNGEAIDSWLTFPVLNYIDVDSSFGKLTNLLNYKNQLFFWQDKAFGVLPVLQQALVSGDNASAIVLGTGGVLQRYDYISTVNGCSYRFGVTDTSYGLYWYDKNNKYILRYDSNGVNPISSNRLNSLFINSGISNDIDIQVNSIQDRINNTVLFTVPIFKLSTIFSITTTSPISTTFRLTVNSNYSILNNFQVGKKVLVNIQSYYTGYNKVIHAIITSIDESLHTIDLSCAGKEDYTNLSYSLLGNTAVYSSFTYTGTYHAPLSVELINGKTLVYSEPTDSFIQFNTIYPKTLIRYDNYFLSSDTGLSLYSHNNRTSTSEYTNKNTFYGVTYPSKLSFIVNGEYNETKTFDRLEYISTSTNITYLGSTPGYNSGVISTPDTFNYIRVTNDYQNSGYTPIVMNSNLIRKERGFILGVPRNQFPAASGQDILTPSNTISSVRLFKERIRDKYMKVELLYSPITSTQQLKIPYIKTQYRISKR